MQRSLERKTDRQTERETEEMNMKQLGISQTWCECCIWWYLVRSQASLWWYCFVVILNVWMNGEFRFGLEGNCGSWGKSQQRRCAELSMSVASACVSVCRECFVDVFRQCTVCVCHWHLHGKGCKLLPQQTRSQNFSNCFALKSSKSVATAASGRPCCWYMAVLHLWLNTYLLQPLWMRLLDPLPFTSFSLPFTSFVNPMGDFDMTWPSWHILTKCISDLTFIIYVSGLIDHSGEDWGCRKKQ